MPGLGAVEGGDEGGGYDVRTGLVILEGFFVLDHGGQDATVFVSVDNPLVGSGEEVMIDGFWDHKFGLVRTFLFQYRGFWRLSQRGEIGFLVYEIADLWGRGLTER